MNREIYLDNSATTRPYDEVIEQISEINRNFYGNPSSMHTKGIEAERMIREARTRLGSSLSCDARELVFTSGGTESNNLAIRGYLEANPRKGKHLITSAVEHPSVLEVFRYLAEQGYRVDFIPVDGKGRLNLEVLQEKLDSDTALISLLYVNNETGAILPLDEVIRLKNQKAPEAVLHIDAVQAYGKLPINLKKTGIDLMSMSSHKIHGPKGTGALYIRNGIRMKPLLLGGGQETLLRSGTENVTGICGFGLASSIIFREMEEATRHVAALKRLLLEKLQEADSLDFITVSPEDSSPYILNLAFRQVKAEVLLHHLEERNIYVSTGSACSSRKTVNSHVLRAMGIHASYIGGAIRFSFSSFNQQQDIMEVAKALEDILPKIQINRGGKR